MDVVALLNEVLSQNPSDAFARYGLAMEYSKNREIERALEEFGKLLTTHPDYTAGYFMAAQTLAKAERVDEAKKMLADGIASARKQATVTLSRRWKPCWRNWVTEMWGGHSCPPP